MLHNTQYHLLGANSQAAVHSVCLQEDEITYLEDAIRNRLAGRSGASGRAEKLAAKKSQFSQDEWAKITLYMAFMAREVGCGLAGVCSWALT